MQILVGTSGYAYKEWRGSFYPEKMKEKDMLRYYAERFADRRDQQHLLPAARPRDAAALGGRGAARLRLRAEGLAAHHPPPAALGRSRRRRSTTSSTSPPPSASGSGPSSSRPRPSSRRTWPACATSWPSSRRRGPSRSSSATRPGGTRRSTRRCAPATRPSSAPTPRSRARRARPSCRPRTGATCACAAATTTTRGSRRGRSAIRAQPWQKAFVFFKHEDDKPLGWPAIERFLASVR